MSRVNEGVNEDTEVQDEQETCPYCDRPVEFFGDFAYCPTCEEKVARACA